MEEPIYLNPLDLYIVQEFAADGADCKAIAETYCGLFYEEDEIRELYQVSQLYKIGEANITLLLDEINISNAIKSLMYKICNGEDKSIGISKEQFEHLETRHPMLEVSDSFDDEDDDEDKDEDSYNCNVIYYRKESRNHTILITTAGISEYKDGECRELEWNEIDSARYDEENNRYKFICNDELFDKNIIIGKYDMIKWSEATPLVTSVLCSMIEIIAEGYREHYENEQDTDLNN